MVPKFREDPVTKQSLDPDEFWQFSVGLYADETVKATCLSLQDSYGADVNLLLLTRWLDASGQLLPEAALPALIEISTYWQTTELQPQRQRRKACKKGTKNYRQALERELAIERQEQQALVECAARWLPDGQTNLKAGIQATPATSETNLMMYGNLAGLPLPLLRRLRDSR